MEQFGGELGGIKHYGELGRVKDWYTVWWNTGEPGRTEVWWGTCFINSPNLNVNKMILLMKNPSPFLVLCVIQTSHCLL